MKKTILISILGLLLMAGIVKAITMEPSELKEFFDNQENDLLAGGGGSTYDKEAINLIGTSASTTYSFATSTSPTTTEPFKIEDADQINLDIAFLASTTVNRLQIYPEVSYDGSSWFVLSSATSTYGRDMIHDKLNSTNPTSSAYFLETGTTTKTFYSYPISDLNNKWMRLRIERWYLGANGSSYRSDSNGEFFLSVIKRLTK